MITTLHIVRHATPDRNSTLNYKVPPGPGLTDVGQKQAHVAALYLANCDLQHVVVSPLLRALQTGSQIALHNKVMYTIDDRLAEHRDDESRDDVARRIRQCLDSLDHLEFERVAVTSHGSPIRAMLVHLSDGLIDLAPYETAVGNPSVPAGIWCATRCGPRWSLEYVFEPNIGDWDRRKKRLAEEGRQPGLRSI